MAILEIEIGAEEQARLQQDAQQAGVSVSEWARRRLFAPAPVTFTTDDGEVYDISDLSADLGHATARVQRFSETSNKLDEMLELLRELSRKAIAPQESVASGRAAAFSGQ